MSTVLDELRRRFEETRVRVRSQIENIRSRLGLPQKGILGGKLYGGSSSPGIPIMENVRSRVQQTLTNIQSRIKQTRERLLGGKGILGGLMPTSTQPATKTSTEIVAKPPEKKPSKPVRIGVHY